MSKVLLDQSAPKPCIKFPTKHVCVHTAQIGLEQLVNGKLSAAAEERGFDVLLSADQGFKYQTNMSGRKIAIVTISANNWPIVKPHVQRVVEAVDNARAGTVTAVWCGEFKRVRRSDASLP